MEERREKLIRNEREAIECINNNRPTSGYEMLKESLDMAVVALERQVSKDFFELPVQIGGTVYEKELPKRPNVVIGYRIGRMMGEEPEDYEDDYEPDVWYIQYARSGVESSSPITEIGESIFLTPEDAELAASQKN